MDQIWLETHNQDKSRQFKEYTLLNTLSNDELANTCGYQRERLLEWRRYIVIS
jgi:hypothetical protein